MAIDHGDRALGRRSILHFVQAFVCLATVMTLLLAPPAQGRMAFYPVTEAGRTELPGLISAGDRQVLARTGLAGGYVVYGQRPSVVALFFEHGIVAIAATEGGCIGGTAK